MSSPPVRPTKLQSLNKPNPPASKPMPTPPTPNPPAGGQPTPSLIKKMTPDKKTFPTKTFLIALLIILAGIGTGYGLTAVSAGSTKSSSQISEQGIKVGDVVGSNDEKTFKDKTSGVLVKGGIDGEGSHHLLREGGPDKTAYVTSSIVDLDLFIDHEIEIWGETFAAQKAGWLMDVGRVKVLRLNAPKPFEEEE